MRTCLYEEHCALGAKMIDFCGWEMPLQYKGIVHEHLLVRSHVGLFDVSHMGRIVIEGEEAERLVDYLSTNEIASKPNGSAIYTVWCDEKGMSVDDLVAYKESPSRFFVIVNACNREKDLKHLQRHAETRKVFIADHYETDGILALQGPKAESLLGELFPGVNQLKAMHFVKEKYQGDDLIISRTGYTGAGGFELYGPHATIKELWAMLLWRGRACGIEPIGLGARDTLRLEMGYALYGHELSDSIAPTESVSSWTVKLNKHDFLGKQALEALETSPSKRSECGIIMEEKGIARQGYEVYWKGKRIGVVTSGTFSPSLNRGIAIVLLERNLPEGDSVEVKIRENYCPGKVIKLPFYKKYVRRK